MSHKKVKQFDDEPTTQDILEAILDFSVSVDHRFEQMEKKMNQGFADVRSEMNQGFADLRSEMKQGFADVRNEIKQIHKRLDEIEEDLKKLRKQSLQDSGAQGIDIVALQKEVKILKEKVLKLEAAHG